MNHKKIRIAKLLANYNYGSRREIEKLIFEKKIVLNNKLVNSPATFANENDKIFLNKKKIVFYKKTEIYKFYKPKKIICSKAKQDERIIIYEVLPKKFKNFIFAGRLDFLSEGLMIITNSSEIARNLELPKNEFSRIYLVRVYGELSLKILKNKSEGTTINKINYKSFSFKIISQVKKNTVLEINLKEGKKNEIREIFKSMNLQVNKLKRTGYGPFKLEKLKPGEIKIANKKEIDQYENYFRK